MKKLAFMALLSCFLAACGQQEPPKQAAAAATVVPVAPVKAHHYSLKDGYEYGYERAISTADQSKGQATSSLVMAKFAGQRDGKYQAYVKAPNAATVMECSNPCEFIKIMSFYGGELIGTERIRAMPGIVGWMILEDAMNGELETYVAERDGKKNTIWFDEKKGLMRFPVLDSPSAKTR